MYINYAFSTVNLMYTTKLWYGGAYIAMRKFDEGWMEGKCASVQELEKRSSVLRGPNRSAEAGAAGREAAAAVMRGRSHDAAVCHIGRSSGHNFTLRKGHWDTSLLGGRKR